jgi:hypothetical protein
MLPLAIYLLFSPLYVIVFDIKAIIDILKAYEKYVEYVKYIKYTLFI